MKENRKRRNLRRKEERRRGRNKRVLAWFEDGGDVGRRYMRRGKRW